MAKLAAPHHGTFATARGVVLALALAGCGENKTHPLATTSATDAGAATPTCVPNLDSVIDTNEVPTVLDIAIPYTVNPAGTHRDVDLVGLVTPTGAITWDFGTSFADDAAVTITAKGLGGTWFASSFPDGDFTTPLDRDGKTLAVYHATHDALLLLGLVSPSADPVTQKTLLVYDPPVVALQYPLAPGVHWTATGTIRGGTLNGEPYNGVDRYDVIDDAVGTLTLRDFIFEQVHRIRTTVTVTPSAGTSGAAVVTKQVAFLDECFGEIVHVEAAAGEPKSDFTNAVTLRRIAP